MAASRTEWSDKESIRLPDGRLARFQTAKSNARFVLDDNGDLDRLTSISTITKLFRGGGGSYSWNGAMRGFSELLMKQPDLDASLIERLRDDELRRARIRKRLHTDRGREVHAAVAGHLGGEVDLADVPSRVFKQVAAARHFADCHEPKNTDGTLVERLVCCPDLGYAGFADLIWPSDDGGTLVDFKNTKGDAGTLPRYEDLVFQIMGLELNRCAALASGLNVDRALVVYLSETGDYSVLSSPVESHREFAESIVSAYRVISRVHSNARSKKVSSALQESVVPSVRVLGETDFDWPPNGDLEDDDQEDLFEELYGRSSVSEYERLVELAEIESGAPESSDGLWTM